MSNQIIRLREKGMRNTHTTKATAFGWPEYQKCKCIIQEQNKEGSKNLLKQAINWILIMWTEEKKGEKTKNSIDENNRQLSARFKQAVALRTILDWVGCGPWWFVANTIRITVGTRWIKIDGECDWILFFGFFFSAAQKLYKIVDSDRWTLIDSVLNARLS